MILKGAEIARYLARPDPDRPALLIYGQDPMRVALKRAEAVAALTMLGFAPAPTQKVVVAILTEQPDLPVEQVVKLALKQIK